MLEPVFKSCHRRLWQDPHAVARFCKDKQVSVAYLSDIAECLERARVIETYPVAAMIATAAQNAGCYPLCCKLRALSQSRIGVTQCGPQSFFDDRMIERHFQHLGNTHARLVRPCE